MEPLEVMQQRHSVRQYKNLAVDPEQHAALDQLIEQINQDTGLHTQVFYEEPRCFDSMMAHYGKFTGVKNYIALVGKKSPDLDETLGYYGEEIVLKIQELGLNSCWVAMTHGKSKAEIRKGEKQVCLIAFGHGEKQGIPHKSKPLQAVCNHMETTPEWFLKGMEAALLAPTAMNQQKFFFTLSSDNQVSVACGKGFYTKLDLGIVKYHFELGSGRRI